METMAPLTWRALKKLLHFSDYVLCQMYGMWWSRYGPLINDFHSIEIFYTIMSHNFVQHLQINIHCSKSHRNKYIKTNTGTVEHITLWSLIITNFDLRALNGWGRQGRHGVCEFASSHWLTESVTSLDARGCELLSAEGEDYVASPAGLRVLIGWRGQWRCCARRVASSHWLKGCAASSPWHHHTARTNRPRL